MIVAAPLTVLIVATGQANVLAVYFGRGDPAASMLWDSVARWAAVAALPVTFLVGLLRERLQFASVGDLVRSLEQVGAGAVEAALGRTLRDPMLRVAFPTAGGWLDVSGLPYETPDDGAQSVTPLGGDPPVAVLIHDPALLDDRELLAAAGAAARLALDNARLHAEVRAQLAEVRASRQRIAAAADSERQRLERDLHDGTQQRLLGVGLALGALRGRLGSVTERALVAELEQELRAAIRELRDLAQGIRPAVLTDQGLGPALAGLARRAAVQVSLDVRLPNRLVPIIEATVYYFVSEALQNVVKHTHVTTARVRVIYEAGLVAVDVVDDGPGGASPRTGTGLRGLADRIDALGGRFEIESPPGGGTLLRAELPCSK
jgi:signal transduction histidine kinase